MRSILLSLLLTAYGLILSFFFGFLLIGVVPFDRPVNIIAGYTIGGAMGLFVAFGLIKKWNLRPLPKVMAAVTLLIFVAAVSVCIQSLMAQVMRLEVILEFMEK